MVPVHGKLTIIFADPPVKHFSSVFCQLSGSSLVHAPKIDTVFPLQLPLLSVIFFLVPFQLKHTVSVMVGFMWDSVEMECMLNTWHLKEGNYVGLIGLFLTCVVSKVGMIVLI